MKGLKEIERKFNYYMLGGIFITQVIMWIILNCVGNFGSTIWCIMGTAILNILIIVGINLLLHKLQIRMRSDEEIAFEEEFYDLFGTD